MTSFPQPKPISSRDREAIIFGLCDRLWDHGHCITNVVLGPAKEDGSPDWQRAAPEFFESLPADEWPDDDQTARRVAVSVDGIDGCARDTSYLLWVDDDGQVQHGRIAGSADDEAIAEAIIARDIGAEPQKRDPGMVAQAAQKLREDIFPLKPANDNAPRGEERLRRLQREFGGILHADRLSAVVIGRDAGEIFINAADEAVFRTVNGLEVVLPEDKPITARPFVLRDPATIPPREWL